MHAERTGNWRLDESICRIARRVQWAGQRLLLRMIHNRLYAADENIIPVAHHACLFNLAYIILS